MPFVKISILILAIIVTNPAQSQQTRFSLATDLSILRSFKKEQQFWSVGQTVKFHFHFTPRDGAYAWLSYYSRGKFTNRLVADAKDPVTLPQQVNFDNKAEMSFKHISFGWQHYFKGSSDSESGMNVYGYAGFGLMFGRATNVHSANIDTATYYLPVLNGEAGFKRLTLDLGIGVEAPVGGDVFAYFEGRAHVPTTDYPSQYLFINRNAPFVAAANVGIRILF